MTPSAKTRLGGKCHCGNIAFELDWEGDPPAIPARACNCTFCIKHGGVWTSNPRSTLSVTIGTPSLVSPYAFGTRTATFHVCARCGAVPLVSCVIERRLFAVVIVNVLEFVEPAWVRRADVSFEGEALDARLARRVRNWIADVRFASSAAAA